MTGRSHLDQIDQVDHLGYLLDGEVTVVRADLDVHRGIGHLLSAEETARSGRFRLAVHRSRFVEARAVLRMLLGQRLDQDPAKVVIDVTEHGKPRLGEAGGQSFNVAHSDGAALFAFASRGEVGVDIERVREVDPVRLSETCFSEAEQAELLALDPLRRLGAFFQGWVRKEAVIKADGRGVSLGLESFTVTLQGPAHLLEAPPGDVQDDWRLVALDAGPTVRAALAVRDPHPFQV